MSLRHHTSALLILMFSALPAAAREEIRAVGSSTVYPFVTVVAEEFGRKSDYKTPIIEATGTGGGFKEFCSGVGEGTPDLINASRAIKASERALCASNGVKDIIEVKIGFDGIAVANLVGEQRLLLTKMQLFKALAKQVPDPENPEGAPVPNPYVKWSDLDSSLPDIKIEVYGPPPTSGTRDAFVELVFEPVCVDDPSFRRAYPEEDVREKACRMMREDGGFIEAGENDNLIVQKLTSNPTALGIFGFSFLDQNAALVQGSIIDGVAPTFETISDGSYPVSRPLYVYVKGEHLGLIPGLKAFVRELISEEATGEDGYLTMRGMIPLSGAERSTVYDPVRSRLDTLAQ